MSGLFAPQRQPGIQSSLKSAGYFIAGFPHVPERLQCRVFERGIGLLQPKAHARFSSRMIRSTIWRISSAEYGV